MFGIKRRFQRCKVWPLRFKEPSVRAHQIWVPPWKVWFLLLSTNLAREWLQIDTDLLRILTSTVDELSSGTNIDDLERRWSPKIGVLVNFSLFYTTAYTEWVNFRWNCRRLTRQPSYEIILCWCCGASHEHYLRFLVGLSRIVLFLLVSCAIKWLSSGSDTSSNEKVVAQEARVNAVGCISRLCWFLFSALAAKLENRRARRNQDWRQCTPGEE